MSADVKEARIEMAEKKNEKKKVGSVPKPIDWVIPEGLVGNYATHVLVQASEKEFYISFFAVQVPVVLGDDAEEQAKSIGAVKAYCVAKVVIDPDRIQAFINALQTTLNNYLELNTK